MRVAGICTVGEWFAGGNYGAGMGVGDGDCVIAFVGVVGQYFSESISGQDCAAAGASGAGVW